MVNDIYAAITMFYHAINIFDVETAKIVKTLDLVTISSHINVL